MKQTCEIDTDNFTEAEKQMFEALAEKGKKLPSSFSIPKQAREFMKYTTTAALIETIGEDRIKRYYLNMND